MSKPIKDKLKALEERRGQTSDEWMKEYHEYRAATSTFGHPSQGKKK